MWEVGQRPVWPVWPVDRREEVHVANDAVAHVASVPRRFLNFMLIKWLTTRRLSKPLRRQHRA